jgi:pimeloyl-ACP methyl ester carboxylesterase
VTRALLLHGAGEDATLWDDVLPLVDVAAAAHELPGHGARPGSPLPDVAVMAADVVAALGQAPAVLVGHSLGGLVALEAALAAPDRVAGLVCVATGAALPVNPALLALLPEGFEEATAQLAAYAAGGREDVAARLTAMLRGNGAETYTADLRACAAYDARERVAGVRARAVVLAGSLDRAVAPRVSAALAEGLRVELTLLDDVSHQIPWDAPGAIADAVGGLLRGG